MGRQSGSAVRSAKRGQNATHRIPASTTAQRPPPNPNPNPAWRPSTPPSNSVAKATVSVSVYRPTDARDPAHWAIHICSPSRRRTIQQITLDDRGDYCVDDMRWHVNPERSSLHDFDIECSTIPVSMVAAARDLVQQHSVDNNSTTWNCQAWVLECLDLLRRARLLKAQWRAIQRMRRLKQRWQ